MRIALVSEHASPLAVIGGVDAGGQNVHVAALARSLTEDGHEVTVFTRRDSVSSPTRVRAPDGYVVEHLPAGPPTDIPKDDLFPHMAEFAEHLEERLEVLEPDVVHSHFWMSGLASITAAATLGIPVAHTFHALGCVKERHQGAKDTSPPQRGVVEQQLCQAVDRVIATCSDEVRELVALGADPARISVVPCGVDSSVFKPLPRRAPDGEGRVLVVGRLVERKGIEDVIRAVAMLPRTRLQIAGGPERDALVADPEAVRLQQIIDRLEVSDRVELLGAVPREDMPALFGQADVVATAPWYEPFGIVPLEAMACGRPIVGTAVGGLLDTIVAGSTGELVPPRRPDQLALALDGLLRDRERARRYGEAGRRRVLDKYDWSRVAAMTTSAYAEVAEPARRTVRAVRAVRQEAER